MKSTPCRIVLGVVVGVMMVSYVALPSRLIGIKATYSRRDKLTASALSTALGVVVCTPPYLLARLGILMLGSSILRIPGIFVLTFGVTLQAGATGSVRAIKMSASLIGGGSPKPGNGQLVDPGRGSSAQDPSTGSARSTR